MSALPWYRRFPDNFISGTVFLTLEEKGAYAVIIDLIYLRGGPVPDEPSHIAGVCNCSARKWNAIRQRLLDLGKIYVVDGCLMNARAAEELEIAAKTARERAENGSKGGDKSGQIRSEARKNKDLNEAKLKLTRASPLPELFKEEGEPSQKESEEAPASTVTLDRHASHHAKLFEACEKVTGQTVPTYLQRFAFPIAVVASAQKRLSEENDLAQVRREAAA